MIVEAAPAKINLALHVRRRRADGYHDIETLFAFAEDGDVVTVEAAAANRFTITGPFAATLLPTPFSTSPAKVGAQLGEARESPPTSPNWASASAGEAGWEGNLVTAAADAFATTFDIDQHHALTLEKRLPIASGIGGGSADAAATLRALARLHNVDLRDDRLVRVAADLGADVPACLLGRTTIGTGKGDALVEIDGLSGMPLLLVNPGVGVPTAAIFASWDGIDRGALPDGDLLTRARAGRNDLEPPARTLAPTITEVRALLDAAPGVLLSRMSGSGATCFALFETAPQASNAAHRARARGWWCLDTRLA